MASVGDPLGALIGGAFSLGGGLLQDQFQASEDAANRDASMAAYQGLGMTTHYQSLRDAANASGFSPLALLPGAQTWSPPSQSVGTGLSGALGDIGQNLSRMTLMSSKKDDVLDTLKERSLRADVEGKELENAKLRHDVTNTIGSPKLGDVQIGTPKAVLERAVGGKPGERMDFPYNLIGDTGNFIWNAGHAVNRAIDWAEDRYFGR